MRGRRDLITVIAVAAASAGGALLVPIGWLSLLLLCPLAFFLTGYAIATASFADAPQPWPRRFWISLGLSLAVLAILPLPLNYLGGLTPGTWAAALLIVVLLACAVAAARGPSGAAGDAARLRIPKAPPVAAALAVLAVAIAAAAIVLAHVPVADSDAVGFTELWLRPTSGAAGAEARIGVGNEEQTRTAYVVRVKFAGGGEETRQLVLAPGETSTFQLAATPQPTAGRPTFVSVLLFRRGHLTLPYRQVYGWIPVGAGR